MSTDRPASIDRSRDERGSVTLEYTVLLSVVAVGVVLAMVGLGVPLVRTFLGQEAWLLLALP